MNLMADESKKQQPGQAFKMNLPRLFLLYFLIFFILFVLFDKFIWNESKTRMHYLVSSLFQAVFLTIFMNRKQFISIFKTKKVS